MIHLFKVHQVPRTFLEQDNTEGKAGLPQNPGTHRVNPRYTSTASGQVHMEDGAESRNSIQPRRIGFGVKLSSSPASTT